MWNEWSVRRAVPVYHFTQTVWSVWHLTCVHLGQHTVLFSKFASDISIILDISKKCMEVRNFENRWEVLNFFQNVHMCKFLDVTCTYSKFAQKYAHQHPHLNGKGGQNAPQENLMSSYYQIQTVRLMNQEWSRYVHTCGSDSGHVDFGITWITDCLITGT